jgi:hypothetical protein
MATTPQQQKQRKQKLSNQHKPTLQFQNWAQLLELFEHKQWEIDTDHDISLLSKFMNTLNLLNNEQQQFLIELTKDFQWYDSRKYLDMMIKPLQDLRQSIGDKFIFFAQCLPNGDLGKNKSSARVLYDLADSYLHQHVNIGRFQCINSVNEANEQMLLDGKAVLVLVDDYVGTGDTAIKALTELRGVHKRLQNYDSVKVFTLVAQSSGMEAISNIGVDVFCSVKIGKGISDQPINDDEKYKKIVLMEGVERRINGLEKKYNFGYKGSEALVSMIRCPNNTFPIYWYIEGVSPYERKH